MAQKQKQTDLIVQEPLIIKSTCHTKFGFGQNSTQKFFVLAIVQNSAIRIFKRFLCLFFFFGWKTCSGYLCLIRVIQFSYRNSMDQWTIQQYLMMQMKSFLILDPINITFCFFISGHKLPPHYSQRFNLHSLRITG